MKTVIIGLLLLVVNTWPINSSIGSPVWGQPSVEQTDDRPKTDRGGMSGAAETGSPDDAEQTDEAQSGDEAGSEKPSGVANGVAEDQADEKAEKKLEIPPALDVYRGRRIAKTMHYSGAPWLIRDEREREERCSLMLANLGVRRKMAICDMGCGVGFHTMKLAQLTGPNGYVVGVDVQPQMLVMMRKRMEEQGIENVVPILGSYHNPRLPRDTFDMVLMVDVYHEFSHPQQMLAAIGNSLKDDGVIVLVEYRAEDQTVPIKPEHKMTKSQIDDELEANGFTLVKSFNQLPWQHMLFYGKKK